MRRVSPQLLASSYPGSSTRPNQDRMVAEDRVGVVVDGAGLPAELRRGCHHDVEWYAEGLARAVARWLADPALTTVAALERALADVRAAHGDGCRPEDGSPSATMAAWRLREERVELLVLSDASAIVRTRDGRCTRLTDQRLITAVWPEVQQAVRDGLDGAGVRAARLKAVERTRNRPGGFWCCHHDPSVAREALTASYDLREVDTVVLASDGGTRGVDLGLQELEEVVDLAATARHDQLCDEVRAAERARIDRLTEVGEKAHDDLTVVSLRLGAA